ncbi:MAG TPA: hypothetical protein VK179_20295 [Bacteroidales bacterium]|nr:hypothetical protein [Bacteroidales bacterium]
MRKFRNWCNNNQGFIAFWAFFLYVFVEILKPIKPKMPMVLQEIYDIFIFKVHIPIFALLILLILILIIFKSKIGRWNFFFLKSVRNKVIDIVSDETTQFIGSPSYRLEAKSSFAFSDNGYWKGYVTFPELSSSKWICHTKLITDEEATKGGSYSFEKEFHIDYNIELIEEALFSLVVDDLCLVALNCNIIGNFAGYLKLNQVNIKNFIKKGSNKLRFDITNNTGLVLDSDQYNNYINRKGELNPYGIKYILRIINK